MHKKVRKQIKQRNMLKLVQYLVEEQKISLRRDHSDLSSFVSYGTVNNKSFGFKRKKNIG
jgi:hypothetical protein